MEKITPKVVIQSIVYNHEKYIRDALDGFVMQKTNFPFVALVHDDASTDATARIIQEYALKYPDIIKPIYESENQYSKQDGSLENIINDATCALSPQYIALCEGDDYWTDPLKLQKQVDFLDSHPDYTMCFGNAIEHWENVDTPDKLFSAVADRDYSGLEIMTDWVVPTASVLYRHSVTNNFLNRKSKLFNNLIAKDILLFLTCAKLGKVKGFSDVFSVYRRLTTGVVRSKMDQESFVVLIHEISLGNIFKGEIRKHLRGRVAKRTVSKIHKLKTSKETNLKYIWRGFRFAPLQTLRLIFHYIFSS